MMRFASLALMSNLMLVSVANAQVPGSALDHTVSGSGTITVKKMPTTMRMTILFKESGKTMPDAFKNLKDRRAAAKAILVKLGAKNDSIREGSPSVAGEDPQAAQMAAMMMAQQGGSKKKKSSAAAKVTVAGNLSGEWPLPNGSNEEILLFVQELKDKVQAADIGGKKEQKKVSAEEQEEMEEMQMMQRQYGNRPEAKPGEPTYLFFAKISAEEQQTARTGAFRKARTQAEQLATAAGGKLGKLRSLQSSGDGNASMHMMHYGYPNGGETDQQDDGDENDDEGLGKSPVLSKISFTYSVQAMFEIE